MEVYNHGRYLTVIEEKNKWERKSWRSCLDSQFAIIMPELYSDMEFSCSEISRLT